MDPLGRGLLPGYVRPPGPLAGDPEQRDTDLRCLPEADGGSHRTLPTQHRHECQTGQPAGTVAGLSLFSPPFSLLSLSSLSLKCASLLCTQVLEPDYFGYLSERPLGDGLFYCYRWFLVLFKRGQSMGCTNLPPTHKAILLPHTCSHALSHTHTHTHTRTQSLAMMTFSGCGRQSGPHEGVSPTTLRSS